MSGAARPGRARYPERPLPPDPLPTATATKKVTTR
jgi:hypothetical protein